MRKRVRFIAILIVALAIAALGWYLLAWRSPYTGNWVNVDVASETLHIQRVRGGFQVEHAGDQPQLMTLDADRLRAARPGSTLELLYDAPTDQLRYPIFSDTVRHYRRRD